MLSLVPPPPKNFKALSSFLPPKSVPDSGFFAFFTQHEKVNVVAPDPLEGVNSKCESSATTPNLSELVIKSPVAKVLAPPIKKAVCYAFTGNSPNGLEVTPSVVV